MKTQLEELDSNRVRLTVEVPAQDVDHAFEHALHDLTGMVYGAVVLVLKRPLPAASKKDEAEGV